MGITRVIVCDNNKCNKCGLCEVACSIIKEENFDLMRSLIRVADVSHPHGQMAVACQLCEDPPCVISCPRDALRREETGIIRVDEIKCTGCGWCIQACDFGAITTHPTKKIVICDLCDGDPECIKFCPYDALKLNKKHEVSSKLRFDAIANLFPHIVSLEKAE